jgi:hypothetical protein
MTYGLGGRSAKCDVTVTVVASNESRSGTEVIDPPAQVILNSAHVYFA